MLDKLEVKNYDKVVGYAGRKRKPIVNWITESTVITNKSLTKEEFTNIVKEHHSPCGELTYKKFRQTYSSGLILYKHVLIEVMY